MGRSFLPDRFVDRMTARYGWTPPVDEVTELADVMQGVQMALHHLSDPGDGIVVHVPAYHPFLGSIERMGRRRVDVPAIRTESGWAFDHDELDRRLTAEPARMLLLCHPHNPVGHVFDRSELERLAEIVARHDLSVISDEIHAELVHPGHQHVPFASLGPEVAARTVTITSSSKAFNLAGLRWALMHAGPTALRDALTALPTHYFGAPNLLAVEATGAAWSEGDAWQQAVSAQLDENRHLLTELLAEHLPGVDYVVPDATYLAWLDLRPLGWDGRPARGAAGPRRRAESRSPVRTRWRGFRPPQLRHQPHGPPRRRGSHGHPRPLTASPSEGGRAPEGPVRGGPACSPRMDQPVSVVAIRARIASASAWSRTRQLPAGGTACGR